MMKRILDKLKLIVYICLTILWILVIFSFSMQSGEESSQVSGGFISTVLGVFLPDDFTYMAELEFVVRKLAHYTEYMVLGILMCLTLREAKIPKQMIIGFIICIVIASCDETIQLFSGGRSGKIADVILDGIGAFAGLFLISRFK